MEGVSFMAADVAAEEVPYYVGMLGGWAYGTCWTLNDTWGCVFHVAEAA